MTWAMRIQAAGVLGLALALLLLGAAAALGVIPVAPPAVVAPVLEAVVATLTAVKVAAAGGALLAYTCARVSFQPVGPRPVAR
jgi:hypothetical protein